MPKVFITRQIPEEGPKRAQEIQDEIFRKMAPEKRLRVAGNIYEFAKKLVAGATGEKVYERVRRAAGKNRGGA